MRKFLFLSTFVMVASLGTSGCSAHKKAQHISTPHEVILSQLSQQPVRTAPGVVEYVWDEPMVDVIEVPPGLDPDGIYYRPAHQEVVEIRQGRWKYYRSGDN